MAVGSAAEIGRDGTIIDLEGRFAVPGFIDNHTHFIDGGFELSRVQLRDAATPQEFARRIADYAKKTGTDLILMGTHGRGMMGHLFMGSVAERVVRIAPCPVLTLRRPEHEFVLPDALQAVTATRR